MIEHPNYSFKNIIGHGGMATVYLAEHNTLHQPVAIKVLNKEFVHNENIRKRFLAEARNMFKMSHPNIIKVTDLIDQDDLVAFVMEYMDGQTLKDYLDKKGKLPDEEIKQLFTQMLDAVGYVHEQGLIHRDIKPSNFMISSKGVIKLLDFGIAKNSDLTSAEYTQTGTAQNMGTPMYMSPEQVKSTKDVTAQSDIYSLGVVLWQMVVGHKPYNTDTTSTWELQTMIVNDPLPTSGTSLDNIIQKATHKYLISRYSNCHEFKENLMISNTERTYSQINKLSNSENNEKTIFINDTLLDKTKIESFKPITTTEKSIVTSNSNDKSIINYQNNNSGKSGKIKSFLFYSIIFAGLMILAALIFFINKNKSTNSELPSKYSKNGEIDSIGHRTINYSSTEIISAFDVDENQYNTVKIGSQIWMKENLKTTRYRDGSKIEYISEGTKWQTLSYGAYSWYDNNQSNKNISNKNKIMSYLFV